jgi:thiamine pyrophosphokinase
MIDTIIVSGGDIQSDFALYFLKKNIEKAGRENIRLIAVDRGLEFFLDYLILPDVVIGDFDSLSEDGKNFLEMQNEDIPYGGMLEWKLQKGEGKVVEVVRLRPEKDDSDTQSAMNYAIQNGAKEIVILGVTGNRVDHLMANFGLLILAQKQDTEVALADRYNYMKLIPSGTILKKAEQFGKYVSFFPLGGDVTGLTLEGFKYPLDKYHLTTADSGLTVSNEISEEYAKVTYESGTLLMIMSRD